MRQKYKQKGMLIEEDPLLMRKSLQEWPIMKGMLIEEETYGIHTPGRRRILVHEMIYKTENVFVSLKPGLIRVTWVQVSFYCIV